jgi:hypothetical protein
MIYRGPGFLAVVWFGSSPIPLPPSPISTLSIFLSLPVCRRSRFLTREGRGWGRSQIIRWGESLVLYKSFNTLCLFGAFRKRTKGPAPLLDITEHNFCSNNIILFVDFVVFLCKRFCILSVQWETDFLGVNLSQRNVRRWDSWTSVCQKTRVFCSMLFTVVLLADFKRKPDSTLILKIHAKKSAKTRIYSWIAFCGKEKNYSRKLDKNSNWEDSSFFPEILSKKCRSRITYQEKVNTYNWWNFNFLYCIIHVLYISMSGRRAKFFRSPRKLATVLLNSYKTRFIP